jgi:hypothetical protein
LTFGSPPTNDQRSSENGDVELQDALRVVHGRLHLQPVAHDPGSASSFSTFFGV